VNSINWPIVFRIALQGGALLLLTFGVTWAGGAEWSLALKSSVGVACGWLLGHLQREVGGVSVNLNALSKENKP
jgi:hypothetical protein